MIVPAKPTPEEAFLAACRYADVTALNKIMSADLYPEEPNDVALHYPDWVVKCGQKVARAHYPKAYGVKNPSLTNAYKLGIALGMMQAGEAKIEITLSTLNIQGQSVPTATQLDGLATLLYGADSGATLPRDGSSLIPEEIKADALKYESEMSLEAKGLYLAGISDAYLMMSGKNAATSTTIRYSTMIIFWRVVEHLDSMEKLHEFLTKIHGANIVGADIKGTRQLCQRIGKRFKAPGRPKLPQAASELR